MSKENSKLTASDMFGRMEEIISLIKQSKVLQLFTIGLRNLLGSSFVYASIFKIQGVRFTPESGETAPIESLPHFFEAMYRSGIYWNFLGWGQMIVGFLLMSHTFSTLGAVAFLPMMLNIFIITLSFDSPAVLTITLLMLLANIYLLLWDWHKLKFIVLPRAGFYSDNDSDFFKKKVWTYLGVTCFIMIVILRLYITRN